MITTQQCTSLCGLIKPLSEFKFRTDTGKYRGQCNACIQQVKKQYQINNQEKIAKEKKIYAIHLLGLGN